MMQEENIIEYTILLSFILSDIVEYPILPRALHIAVTEGTTLIITARAAAPA